MYLSCISRVAPVVARTFEEIWDIQMAFPRRARRRGVRESVRPFGVLLHDYALCEGPHSAQRQDSDRT